MGLTRRELRLLRESGDPSTEDEFYLHPEVLRAVAMKMRERNAPPNEKMKGKYYILASCLYEFIESLEAVADDTDEHSFRYVPQKDINGE